MTPHAFFKQVPQPAAVDDHWHVFNRSNCLNGAYWYLYFQMIEALEFDSIVECGVGRGRSLISLLSMDSLFAVKNNAKKHTIFALDSFEGFPEPCKHDESIRNPQKGDWSHSPNNGYEYSPDFIREILCGADLEDELDRVKFVKGFFDKTCPTLNPGKIGILHLDGDLYESVLAPLQSLWEQVVIGGVVVVDDYIQEETGPEKFPGARKAIEEFLASNDNFSLNVSVRGTPYLIRQR